MYRLIKIFICLILTSVKIITLKAENEVCKKHNLSICALFKDEANNLKEWIDYHRELGVDHFYLYDTGSRDAYQTLLKPYLKEQIVTLVHWPSELCRQCERCDVCCFALSMQIPAYENAVNFVAREETEWLVFLDINEYLVCAEGTIPELLEKYGNYAGIALSSYFFDAPFQDNFVENKELLKSLELKTPLEKSIAKMLFKPDQCEGFIWPPYQCCFKTLQSTTEVSPEELSIHRFKRNKEIPAKTKRQRNTDYKHLIKRELEEIHQNDHARDIPNRALYQQLPEFLKRIIHNNGGI